jgi:hypothetical protein
MEISYNSIVRTWRTFRRAALGRSARVAAVALAAGSLCACVVPPPPRPPPPPPPINTMVYAYPLHGQSADQLDRDQYECYIWAKQQTGFDPSAPNLPAEARVRFAPSGPPPGTNTAVGAVAGAAIGAAIAPPWQRGFGALFGALIGGAIGSSADATNAQRNAQVASYTNAQLAQIDREAANYRRALSACLEGRGYSVH